MSQTKVYYSSTPATVETDKQQQRIFFVLESLKIKFEKVDVCNSEDREFMRKQIGDPKALAPKIFYGDEYCGDFKAFNDAVDCDQLKEFLRLPEQR